MLATRARDNSCWIAFVNAVGAQDELIFDGQSLVLDENGEVVVRGPAFEEALLLVDVDATTAVARRLRDARRRALARALRELPEPPVVDVPLGPEAGRAPLQPTVAEPLGELEEMRLAIELGLRDYAGKNGFADVVLGISGGIDSALTAALAAEALGPKHVVCVSMPSRFSSAETRRDARAVAESVGARYLEIPIDPIVDAFGTALAGRLRRHRARRRRGERPGAGARRDRDGPLQQVRLAARWRPGTRASSRSATRRSTATWPAASRS